VDDAFSFNLAALRSRLGGTSARSGPATAGTPRPWTLDPGP